MKPCDWDSREKYELLIGPLRERARELGYALAVHGTLKRDIDLLACPWTEQAVPAVELAEALRVVAEKVNGFAAPNELEVDEYFMEGSPGAKAHGRLSWTFHLGGGPYIDLSVMPRIREMHIDLMRVKALSLENKAQLGSTQRQLAEAMTQRDQLHLQIETLKNDAAQIDGRGNCSSHACLREKPKGMGTNSGKCYCTQGELRRFIEQAKVDRDCSIAGTEVLRVKLEEQDRLLEELKKKLEQAKVDRDSCCAGTEVLRVKLEETNRLLGQYRDALEHVTELRPECIQNAKDIAKKGLEEKRVTNPTGAPTICMVQTGCMGGTCGKLLPCEDHPVPKCFLCGADAVGKVGAEQRCEAHV